MYTPWKLTIDTKKLKRSFGCFWNMVIWISMINSICHIMRVIESRLGSSNGIQPSLHSPYPRSSQVLWVLSLDECIAGIF